MSQTAAIEIIHASSGRERHLQQALIGQNASDLPHLRMDIYLLGGQGYIRLAYGGFLSGFYQNTKTEKRKTPIC
jgi:hypothetical protein